MKIRLMILLGFVMAALVACDDDSSGSTNAGGNNDYSSSSMILGSSGSNANGLPDTVATLDELLQKYTCSVTYKCAHVYLTEWNNIMECDGEAWAYLSEYTESVCGDGSSSSAVEEFSSSSVIEEFSSSSVVEEFSSSSATVDQCEAMDKDNITTWHFVKDTFAGSVTYTYSIDADGQIVLTTKASDGTEKSQVLYQKSTSIYMEYAYSGALSTCQD